jgi:hypothetical protein
MQTASGQILGLGVDKKIQPKHRTRIKFNDLRLGSLVSNSPTTCEKFHDLNRFETDGIKIKYSFW